MIYGVYDGMGEWVGAFEVDDESEAPTEFRQWLSENTDDDAGALDFSYEVAEDNE